jgi:tRNA(Ile)-lysidine synthase
VHVDHCIRPGSADEADVVAAVARDLGASFRAERAPVEPGPNLEERARRARFAALPDDVLTGHTADDQAETVLLNLLRGAGLDGLAGMGVGRHPIIRLRRSETRALCTAAGLTPVDDPSNADPVHRRNRVRHELLPLLDAIAQRDVAGIIARQAPLLRDEAELLDGLAAVLDPTDARALAAAPVALSRRAVRLWLAAGCEHPPDAATVERVLAVAGGHAKAADIGADRRVARTGQRLRIEALPTSAPRPPAARAPRRHPE